MKYKVTSDTALAGILHKSSKDITIIVSLFKGDEVKEENGEINVFDETGISRIYTRNDAADILSFTADISTVTNNLKEKKRCYN